MSENKINIHIDSLIPKLEITFAVSDPNIDQDELHELSKKLSVIVKSTLVKEILVGLNKIQLDCETTHPPDNNQKN